MSIRPIDFNGMLQRTQDVGTMKHNADNKPVMDQQVLVQNFQKETLQQTKQVTEGEDAQNYQQKYDAREKGSNEYQRNGEKGKKQEEKAEDKVFLKNTGGGFDIKI